MRPVGIFLFIICTLAMFSLGYATNLQVKEKVKGKQPKRISKQLSPQVVDSFRTIILNSCSDDDQGSVQMSMRDEMVKWLNVRYRRAGISMTGVDCSGFIKTLFRQILSLELPHSAAEQSTIGDSVGQERLRFGDLLFFKTTKKRINHVGIYIGNGYFIHSSRTFGVRVDYLLRSPYYTKRFALARRIIDLNRDLTYGSE